MPGGAVCACCVGAGWGGNCQRRVCGAVCNHTPNCLQVFERKDWEQLLASIISTAAFSFIACRHPMQVFERKDWEQLLARSIVPKLAFALQVSGTALGLRLFLCCGPGVSMRSGLCREW